MIRNATQNQRGLVLAGDAAEVCAGFSGWQVDVKKNRRGVLLSPQSTLDGDLVGVRVARSMLSTQVSLGRGLLHPGTGSLVAVQIPAISEGRASVADVRLTGGLRGRLLSATTDVDLADLPDHRIGFEPEGR